jgi:hypothetical protein
MSFAPITHALPGHLQVSLSAMHRFLGDALDGPLKEGQLGTVVGFDCSVKPCLVRSAGEEWWYHRDAVILVEQQGSSSSCG